MTPEFKRKWLEKLTNGSAKRNRYGLSSDGGETCVMAVARNVATEMGMLPEVNMAGRHYLDDQELEAIGINKKDQFYLANLNDQYIAKDGQFPKRVINAIGQLPALTDNRVLVPVSEE